MSDSKIIQQLDSVLEENEDTSYYKPRSSDNEYALLGYDSNDNHYTFLYHYKTEEDAIKDVEHQEKCYIFDYYVIYKDAGFDKKIYSTPFYVYIYTRMIASKKCKYDKRMPVPLDTMLIGQYVDDNILGGRWVLFK